MKALACISQGVALCSFKWGVSGAGGEHLWTVKVETQGQHCRRVRVSAGDLCELQGLGVGQADHCGVHAQGYWTPWLRPIRCRAGRVPSLILE